MHLEFFNDLNLSSMSCLCSYTIIVYLSAKQCNFKYNRIPIYI